MTRSSNQASSILMERAVASHVALYVVGVTWAFGGNADWVKTPISLWGSVGILLTLSILSCRGPRRRIIAGTLPWALPVVALNAVVAVSCLTPGFISLHLGNEAFLIPARVDGWIPSAARPEVALRSLWLFDGLYFSCFNLALAVSRRHVIRIVLGVAVANALALAIFGTVQKLVGSKGIYFGSVKSPQDYFFASFVYDNHWGAFVILMLGACVGLILRYAIGHRGEGFFHGPAFAGVIAAVLIAVSVPLSGARACTLLLVALAVIAAARGGPRVIKALRISGATRTGALVGTVLAAIFSACLIWLVAGDAIRARAYKTRDQITTIWKQGRIGSRTVLYDDTWSMARQRLAFGWGMGSFPTVFTLFNTQVSKVDRIPIVYHDAHSDWLQSVAEIGLVGTALIGAAVLLPWKRARWSDMTPIPFFLLTGMLLVAMYAWIEFPFGNVAVVLSWWLCFFSANQHVRLSGSPESAQPTV